MEPTGLNIAVIENKKHYLEARVELVRRNFPGNDIVGYRCAEDLIEDLEGEREFFHVILSDVFMPSRGEDLEEEGTWEQGAGQILKWMERARRQDQHGDFEVVQLVLISRTNRQKTLPAEIWSPERMYWLQYVPDRSGESTNWEFAEFRRTLYQAMIRALPPPIPDPSTGEAITQSPKVQAVYQEARKLAILRDADNPLVAVGGSATLQNRKMTLQLRTDLTGLTPGRYLLGVRKASFRWAYYPIALEAGNGK